MCITCIYQLTLAPEAPVRRTIAATPAGLARLGRASSRQAGHLIVPSTRRALIAAASVAVAVASLAACSPSPGATQQSALITQQSALATQTITFAISGLGSEGQYTETQVGKFEKLHPNIHVAVEVLSSDSTTFLSQVDDAFAAGSSTPDLVESDITYTAEWAAAGYLQPVSCPPGQFNPGMISTGKYQGKLYSCPWFLNVEGLWYRTDLVPTPPATAQQVVTDAERALDADPELKEGIAFEGDKYEGAITAYMMLDKAFGGSLDNLSNVDTQQNVAALNFLHSLIYQYHVAPADMDTYQEGQSGIDFAAGYAAFCIDWPYAAGLPLAPAVKGHVGFIPFPPAPGGSPGAALGGEVLSVNAKSSHAAAVNELVDFLTGPAQETARAIAVADAPAVSAAYTRSLFTKAPIFKAVQAMARIAATRPVTPEYPYVSADLQELISSAYANPSEDAAPDAFKGYAGIIATDSGAAS
jgi:multiple sugar transport system substrate-binding protein